MQNDPNIPLATRAPPLATKKIPRAVWIGGAIAGGLLACLACTCGGIGVQSVVTTGKLPFMSPAFVGKWEPAQVHESGTFVEFKSDGTGTTSMPNPLFALTMLLPNDEKAKLNEKDRIARSEFRWEMSPDNNLTIDGDKILDLEKINLFALFRGRTHYRFKREGDTLTLTPVQPGKDFVLRKAKAN